MKRKARYKEIGAGLTLSDLPHLKILFHADDHKAGTNTWASRIGGLVLTYSNTLSIKDADGVGASGDQDTVSYTGTMPTLTKYAVAFAVGRMETAGSVTGLNSVFGFDPRYINAYANAAGPASAFGCPPPSPNLTVNGDRACVIGLVDLISSANPIGYRALANLSGEVASSTGSMSLGTNLNSLATGPLGDDVHHTPLNLGTTRAGSRSKMLGVFDFPELLTESDIREAAVYMVENYGKLWPRFYS